MFGQRDSSTTQNASDPMGAPTLPTSDTTASAALTTPAPTEPAASTFSSSILDSPAAPTPVAPSVTAPTPTASVTTDPATTDDLIRMKQEALQHLQPLVGSLQQAPEEEFRTLMMMIQATDDRTLLKKALDSAKSIKDDKIRAQAMLDVINEINYFTQTSQE